ncbi:Uncharacterised protein [Pseudomonas luteola]|uniref:Uncharacterized protein n=2 Tax=Pseudomonas TaxID=286 RepID=A0A2X2EAG4_PSELU|nr:hypothetical protein SAMN05216409_12014 [Pseudomonas lutea]SPZ05159.1 Uncharacterised protein [Pseudomonas luteola]
MTLGLFNFCDTGGLTVWILCYALCHSVDIHPALKRGNSC